MRTKRIRRWSAVWLWACAAACVFTACQSGMLSEGDAPSDEAFEGRFFDAARDITLFVNHEAGSVTASGYREDVAPGSGEWELLYFSGHVMRASEATGVLEAYSGEVVRLGEADVTLHLDSATGTEPRNRLTFTCVIDVSTSIHFDGVRQ